MLGERFPAAGRGLCLLNDSDAALAGEIWSPESAFKSAQNVAMISKWNSKETFVDDVIIYNITNATLLIALGTGIGTSLLLQGKFYSGTNGLIEGGHMVSEKLLPYSSQCS
jgi:predicted NBD/HSP70 family sugar kinase